MKFAALLLASLFLFSSLVSCSESSKTPEPTPELPDVLGRGNNDPIFNRASCRYAVNDGNSAQMAHLARTDLKTAAFGKTFNQAVLEGILDTSIAETVRYIKASGVSLFRVGARSKDSCDNFISLPPPPHDLSARWLEAAKDDGEGGRGYVLAFYQPQDPDSAQITTRTQPAIVIRQDNDRYTLVHEFMHHLFYVQAAANGVRDSQMRKDVMAAQIRFEAAAKVNERDASEGNKIELARAFLSFYQKLDFMLIHFTLEEMTIEDILRQAKESGKYKFISDYGRVNGSHYVHSSAGSALGLYNIFVEEGEKMKGSFFGVTEALDLMEQMEKSINERKAEINAVTTRNPALGREMIRDFRGLMLPGPLKANPCPHEHAIDGVIQSAAEALKRY